MNEFLGYVKWQVHGALRTPSFYGFVLILLSVTMMLGGCPEPWPAMMSILGLAVVMFDLARVWYRISLADYRYQRDRVVQQLTKEHQ